MLLNRKECNELLKLLNPRQCGKTTIYNKIREEIIKNIKIETDDETLSRIINNLSKTVRYNLNTNPYECLYKYNLPHFKTVYFDISKSRDAIEKEETIKIVKEEYIKCIKNNLINIGFTNFECNIDENNDQYTLKYKTHPYFKIPSYLDNVSYGDNGVNYDNRCFKSSKGKEK